MSFDSLGLSHSLLRVVAERGFARPTPIQGKVIPLVLEGRDVVGCAQTGTGKTAAFALPIIERLAAARATAKIAAGGRSHSSESGSHSSGSAVSARLFAAARATPRPRALILTPTRELAAQVAETVDAFGAPLRVRCAAVFGGVNIGRQVATLARGVDVVVATPGRLLDHAAQRTIDLSAIEVLVLDEADRMLDMGFLPAIRRVLALLPAARQTLLFSATLSDEIRSLAAQWLRSPARVDVAPPNVAAEAISQVVRRVEKSRKREALSRLIAQGNWRQVLVFTRTKHGANRLARQLEQDGLRAAAIHGNKSQGARTRALAAFKDGSVRVLVATDVAARGLDIEQLPHVVNYELPDVPEHYVHRIGRTGRAGRAGVALSLVSGEERKLLAAIERLIGRRIPESPFEDREDRGAAQPRAVRRSRASDARVASRRQARALA